MRCWLGNWRTVLVPVAALILSACASAGEKGWVEPKPEVAGSGPMLHITGTVHHLDLEGGLFVIRDAGGTQYNPVNLPEAFRVEGMAVEADARRRDEVAWIGMVGPVVELLRIRTLPGKDASANGLTGTRWRLLASSLAALLFAPVASGCDPPATIVEASPEEIRAFFKGRKVLTFLGYSGAEYENKAAMLEQAARILDRFDPRRTVVNIGATAEGIGAVYEAAKRKGFLTTGIVSTQAKENKVALSPWVDIVFYVKDATWGGFLPGTERLSPTSQAMVENSDVIVAIGGGEVARDELIAAKRMGKRVQFIAADMNHRIAREKALKKGQPEPTDFRGAAATAF